MEIAMSDEIKKIEDETPKVEPSAQLPEAALDEVVGGAALTQVSNTMKTKHDTVKNTISNIH
jgi:hypothetical protein